jgi:tetratricopeptide (TPR) repeat protein
MPALGFGDAMMAKRLILCLALLLFPASLSAAWHEARTRHFIIYSDDQPDRLQRYAERLERFDQAARRVLGMSDPQLTESQKLTVYAVKSEEAVSRLIGTGVAGYYDARADGAFTLVPRRAGYGMSWDLNAEQIFFHEYAHHLQLQFNAQPLPKWLVEGFAEFFATALIDDQGNVKIGSPPRYRAVGIHSPTVLTLPEMLDGANRRMSSLEFEQLYARGWQLIHFLNFEPSRKGQLQAYVDGIRQGTKPLDSAKRAFGDLDRLAEQLREYRGRKTIPALVVDAGSLNAGAIAIRPLSAGHAAMMNVHIRSRRGVNRKEAKRVLADARSIAARYPADPAAQVALAEAEIDAEEFVAAEAAADRALAADPRSFKAMILKGRSRMELARKDPSRADWREIRSWFSKANRLDTESAEPLFHYYETYAAAGANPSKLAVDGLLYAVVLAPQDDHVRMTAVERLLTDNRLTEAKSVFEPLAYKPHASSDWQAFSAQVLAAITAGEAKKALDLIAAERERAEAA